MSRRQSRVEAVLLGLFGLLLLAAGCERARPGTCDNDDSCPAGATCQLDPTRGESVCMCSSDLACAPDEFCNSRSICQRAAACRSNQDCPDGAVCDRAGGLCLANRLCASDVHCPQGAICEAGACVVGCRQSSDCGLFEQCTAHEGAATGACEAGGCRDKTDCEFSQRCVDRACTDDEHPWRCAPCSGADPARCGGEADSTCLINGLFDPERPGTGSESYCAVSCVDEPDCPYGYQCNDIRALPLGQMCMTDPECGPERTCLRGEGEPSGGCSCVSDEDCLAPSSCRSDGVCTLDLGLSCTSDRDCGCIRERCVGSDRSCEAAADCALPCVAGYCRVGRACVPLEGLTCADL